jgi:outer membrane murein-binding lipoprotein Lpp
MTRGELALLNQLRDAVMRLAEEVRTLRTDVDRLKQDQPNARPRPTTRRD